MRCPICNADTEAMDDCAECQSTIAECLQGYDEIEVDEDGVVVES